MCGRIALYSDVPRLARLLDAGIDPEVVDEFGPSWNIGPMSTILGVSEDAAGDRTMGLYRWGLVPAGARDPASIRNTFNARAETVATRPTFRAAFRQRRILVPVDAFYEWKGGAIKQPYVFKRADGDPVVFAGLRERWRGVDGSELRTATIITTEAGPDMPVHDRQPVVLERGAWEHWLDPRSPIGRTCNRCWWPEPPAHWSTTRSTGGRQCQERRPRTGEGESGALTVATAWGIARGRENTRLLC